MSELVLPWPSKDLSPNGRVHWAKKAKAAKAARAAGHLAVLEAGLRKERLPAGRLHLFVDFYPPSRRKYDDDNLLAQFKPYRDGIAEGLGIDDVQFLSHPCVMDETRKGGEVRVRITGAE